MPYPQKATDAEIREAYGQTKSVAKAGGLLGMNGSSVHERLVKMGVQLQDHRFTAAEILLLKTSYVAYRDAGKLADLAKRMGRDKTTICGKARTLGLTSPKHARRYYAIWKYMDEETARVIFEDFRNTRGTMGDYCRRKGLGELGFSRTMQRHFPDEWDVVIEAKAPRQTMYRIGRAFEYRTRDDLKKRGYFVMRSPRSGSPIDLVAIKPEVVLFIQCKRSGQIGVKEWNEVYDLAASVEAVPVLTDRPDSGRGVRYWRMTGRKDGSKRPQPRELLEP
ncbi:hypothetical protein KAW64_14740 [bacterium]|nr:hypothetical protein [bacterium]